MDDEGEEAENKTMMALTMMAMTKTRMKLNIMNGKGGGNW